MEQAGKGGMADLKLEMKDWNLIKTFHSEDTAIEFSKIYTQLVKKGCETYTNPPLTEIKIVKGEHLYYVFGRVG